MDENTQIAYLRSTPNSQICTLSFKQILNNNAVDIKVSSKLADSIQTLLDKTKDVLEKILTKQGEGNVRVNISVTLNETSVDNFACWDFINMTGNAILHVLQDRYKIVINAPLVQNVTLPRFIYIDTVVVPLKFKCIHTVEWMCEFEWSVSKDRTKWERVGTEFSYKPKSENLDCFLKFKVHPKNKKTGGPIYEVVSKYPIKELQFPQEFPFDRRHQYTSQRLSGNWVVSYNILSERYTEDGFEYCPEEFLCLDYRKHILNKEISGYNADIICLQEVDVKILQPFLGKVMMRNGYGAVFNKKGDRIPEGLATFYREDRFTIKEVRHHVLAKEIRSNSLFKSLWQTIRKNHQAMSTFIKQATSVQITVLREKSGEIFIVVNTHLYYYWEDDHIRLIQIAMILKLIDSVESEWRKKQKKSNVPLIFCGDFNSKPHSGVYEFMTTGYISESHRDWKKCKTPVKNLSLEHRFNFISAYGAPQFTNYVQDFQGCLDYIFYDASRLTLNSINPLPDESVLSENIALPSMVFPSDHIALVADLELL